MSHITPVFGGGGFNEGRAFGDVSVMQDLFKLLKDNGCDHIDTAALYGQSEELMGKAKAGDQFIVDTKTKGGFGGSASKDTILKEAENSKKMLGHNVDIFYIHAPDPNTDLEETLEGINEVYKSGFFKRFGLSNYKAEDVERVYNICKEKGYPLPSVYQGNYNPVARKQETLLFPTLRKLNIAFYAYSPIAGGFLTKKKQDILDGIGRFSPDQMGGLYAKLYNRPAYLEALGQWEKVANEEGVSPAELAYRWVTYNSPLKKENGDAIIFGASSTDQVKKTLGYIQSGPLSEKALKGVDGVWKTIEHEAPLDNYHL
ncbi:uncharacterized protein LTR77_001559 [Saxophila tyrrhenica]|uniref:NADP-dependent oxidoreductase domain-containing protein n=1 Tax=Saxophila tyrrhenica TaxID=1690608 RepID=A0AAV9PLU6_9PEZI|nr:hypothetical protein LTR77_001559 [Saxophila tyrrhenica]